MSSVANHQLLSPSTGYGGALDADCEMLIVLDADHKTHSVLHTD
jgi:hypothetical protein